MANDSVKELAERVGITTKDLIDKLKIIGIDMAEDDVVTEEQKLELLGFLQRQHGTSEGEKKKNITLKRKSVRTLPL